MELTELLTLGAILITSGWVAAFLVQLLKRASWPSWVKLVLSLVMAGVVGIASAWLTGDVLGSLQSGGKSSLHFLSLLDDADVIADARELAEEVVSMDLPLADHRPLADLVDGILAPQKVAYLDKS